MVAEDTHITKLIIGIDSLVLKVNHIGRPNIVMQHFVERCFRLAVAIGMLLTANERA